MLTQKDPSKVPLYLGIKTLKHMQVFILYGGSTFALTSYRCVFSLQVCMLLLWKAERKRYCKA